MDYIRTGFLLLMTVAFGVVAGCPGVAASNGEIILGMSAALTGPSARMGKDMQSGILAALARVNRQNGINGRHLRLVVMDDGYEPERTAVNIRSMLYNPSVLAFIGCVGTPTAIAALPIIRETKTLYYAPYTGAGLLRRNPPERYVINFRASYAEEAAAMVAALVNHGRLKPQEVALFTQRDGFGDAGYAGTIHALKDHGLADEGDIVHARYERNTVLVENGLAEILRAPVIPRAIIMFGTHKPCAKFIRLARHHGLNALFLVSSFVGYTHLAEELGAVGDGIIVTSAVAHFSADLPLVREYREDYNRYDPRAVFSPISLEGYVAARILSRALRSIPGAVTKENIIDALERLGDFDPGLGVPLRLSPREHQASHHVWPMIMRGGRFAPSSWAVIKQIHRAEGP